MKAIILNGRGQEGTGQQTFNLDLLKGLKNDVRFSEARLLSFADKTIGRARVRSDTSISEVYESYADLFSKITAKVDYVFVSGIPRKKNSSEEINDFLEILHTFKGNGAKIIWLNVNHFINFSYKDFFWNDDVLKNKFFSALDSAVVHSLAYKFYEKFKDELKIIEVPMVIFDPAKNTEIKTPKERKIFFTGRLAPYKGIKSLIDLDAHFFQCTDSYKLYVFGIERSIVFPQYFNVSAGKEHQHREGKHLVKYSNFPPYEKLLNGDHVEENWFGVFDKEKLDPFVKDFAFSLFLSNFDKENKNVPLPENTLFESAHLGVIPIVRKAWFDTLKSNMKPEEIGFIVYDEEEVTNESFVDRFVEKLDSVRLSPARYEFLVKALREFLHEKYSYENFINKVIK